MLENVRQRARGAREMEWWLGFTETPPEDIVAGKRPRIRWVRNPYKRECWFADPFILDFNDREIILLVEEYNYRHGRGRLARLTVDRPSMRIVDMKIVLALDTHLSFPCILRGDDGRVWVMPENYKGGAQRLYRYDATTATLCDSRTLYVGELADAAPLTIGGRRMVTATESPDHNGSLLKLFNVGDDGTLSPAGSVSFGERTARNAGAPFTVGGTLYRPAQICNGAYGQGVEFQRIDAGPDGKPRFTPVGRLMPGCWRWREGLHTFNTLRGLTVIDGHGYRRPLLGKSIEALAALRRTLLHR